MEFSFLLSLGTIFILGFGAQWLAWRIRIPSILLLLIAGFIVGPLTGVINPDQLFGNLLAPFVSLAVAIILFEGGLTLRLSEIPGVRTVVLSLISVGLLITWIMLAIAAQWLLNLPFSLSLLLGAILTVSGPTVIVPLLLEVKPRAPLGSLLRWEGVLIDPVGAILAVLVFEVLLTGHEAATSVAWLQSVLAAASIGVAIGSCAALVVITSFRRYWVPDYLQNPFVVTIVLFGFIISNELYPESGLLTVTLMGAILANRSDINVHHVLRFKEDLRTLLISILFIVLSARVSLDILGNLPSFAIFFPLVAILIVRPVAVFISTVGASLSWRERFFVAAVAPRGIVAAAVASIFALELQQREIPGGNELVAYTFLTITVTVFFYGLAARPIARLLGVAQKSPQGALIVGASPFATAIAAKLTEHDIEVALIDTNYSNTIRARRSGLKAFSGSALSEATLEAIDLDGIGKLLAMTTNDEANSLACVHFSRIFERSDVYQLAKAKAPNIKDKHGLPAKHLRGRLLFSSSVDIESASDILQRGAEIHETTVASKEHLTALEEKYPGRVVPLFMIAKNGKLKISTWDESLESEVGSTLLWLLLPANGG